jgi:hypothetical protein
MIFKTKLSGILIVAVILTCCTSTQDTKVVELFASKLDPLLGKGAEEVIPMVTDQWEFKLQARWASSDPSPEMVLKKNHHRAPFSKMEAREIFMEKGYYNVLIFAKKGSEDATIEAQLGDEQFGANYHEHVHKYTHYVFVRFVFRDTKLHNCRCFRAQIVN